MLGSLSSPVRKSSPLVIGVVCGPGSVIIRGPGNQSRWSCAYVRIAMMICRNCDWHLTLFAWSYAFWRAGNRIATSIAMIPMTTSNSTSVKPTAQRVRLQDMIELLVPRQSVQDVIRAGSQGTNVGQAEQLNIII